MMKRLKDGYTKDIPELVFFMIVRSVLLILVLLLLCKYTKVSVIGTVSNFNLEVDVSTVGQYTILSDTEIMCDTNTVYYTSFETSGITKVGNAQYVLDSARFQANLVKSPDGTIIGIVFEQLE